MVAALFALVLSQAVPTSFTDARIAVYVTAPTRDGFVDTSKGVEDSIKDIQKDLAKRKGIRVADNAVGADVLLIVVDRGVGVDAYGSRTTARDTSYSGVVVESAPMIANTFWVSTVLQAGTYRKEFVGRHTQEAKNSLGAWGTVAGDLSKQVEAWTSANADQIRARRSR